MDPVPAAQRALAHVAARSSGGPVDPDLRVTLNFHPDRLVLAGGLLVLEAMGRDGRYRSQFETGTSNGGLTAYPGGGRWSWESRIFGAAYDDAPAAERPTYGSLNFRRRTAGGSPRFGSSHLRLRPDTLARTTFCYPDSYTEPDDFGVAAAMSLIELAEADDPDDLLDDYIEAQVHGPVRLDRDVEAVVLDPSFRGTRVEEIAGAFAARSNGTAASGSPRPSWAWVSGLPRPAVRLAGNRDRGRRAAGSAGDLVTRPVPAATTSKTSSGSGTTWRASACPTDQPGNGDRRCTQTGER